MLILLRDISIAVVALLHIGFLILEMFFWDKPIGRKIFGLKTEFAEQSASLAANQGLYNGFLAAGLIWSFFIEPFAADVRLFFLCCVIIAGVYGAITVSRAILWIQTLPAIIALTLVIVNLKV